MVLETQVSVILHAVDFLYVVIYDLLFRKKIVLAVGSFARGRFLVCFDRFSDGIL